MASDGGLSFSTRLDNSGLEKDLEKAKKSVDKLEAELTSGSTGKTITEKQLEGIQLEAANAQQVLSSLADAIKNITEQSSVGGLRLPEEFAYTQDILTSLVNDISEISNPVENAGSAAEDMASGFDDATTPVEIVANTLAAASNAAKEAGVAVKSAEAAIVDAANSTSTLNTGLYETDEKAEIAAIRLEECNRKIQELSEQTASATAAKNKLDDDAEKAEELSQKLGDVLRAFNRYQQAQGNGDYKSWAPEAQEAYNRLYDQMRAVAAEYEHLAKASLEEQSNIASLNSKIKEYQDTVTEIQEGRWLTPEEEQQRATEQAITTIAARARSATEEAFRGLDVAAEDSVYSAAKAAEKVLSENELQGEIHFAADPDIAEIEQEYRQSLRVIKEETTRLNDATWKRNYLAEQIASLNKEATKASDELDELRQKYFELSNVPEPDTGGLERIQLRAETLNETLVKNQTQMSRLGRQLEGEEGRITYAQDRIAEAEARAADYGSKLGNSLQSAGNEGAKVGAQTATGMSFAAREIGKLKSRIAMMVGSGAVFMGLIHAAKQFASSVAGAAQENKAYAASLNGLKAAAQGVATGIANAILPVLSSIVRAVTAVIMTVARLIDSVFKTKLASSIQEALAAAQSGAAGAAGATGKQSKATDKLAESLKNANRELMSFDELNRLSEDQSDDNADALDDAGSGGGGADAGAGAIIEPIDAALAQIMMIVGAALLAVGAILAFSGINIPLGITLMAIGALMMYTAYTEQWDALSEETKAQIATLMAVVGAALIVLGILLLLMGGPPLWPIGLAALAAGVMLIVTAAELSDDLSDKVTGLVDVLMGIAAGALIALGLILLLCGFPTALLGIAAIAAGIFLFVKATNLSDEAANRAGAFINRIMPIIAGALIVFGLILLLSPFIPLGIAAIAAGILIFVSAAQMNSELIPEQVRTFIDENLGLIGGALIVLGIILCVTGVGIPLGIALIIAGAGVLLVSAMDLDWDFIKNKIDEIWGNITSFFDTYIRPVFTIEWWENLFNSIPEAIQNALDWAWEKVTGFFDDIGGKITGFIAELPINFDFSLPSFDIPFLAKGAVIPANREFLAVLGDQSAGRNLEAPEGLIRQIVREESGGGSSEMVNVMYQLLDAYRQGQTLMCDGQVLGRVAQRELATMERMGGY